MQKGMPLTKKREIIINVIEKNRGHMDAEDVYHKAKKIDPSIGMATVYRSLKLMRDFGVIERHSFGQEHQHFESPTKSHHDHLVCSECGRIVEFADSSLEKLKNKVAKRHGFQMKTHKLEIYGICAICAKKTD
jgi:Fur family ferric uptake transcriptional regulator